MASFVLVLHLLLALALVGTVLVQRSEGGALGGLGGGTMGGLMSGRGTANLLTRTTAILAALFVVTSLTLAVLAGHGRRPASILDTAPATTAAPAAPAPPTADTGPVIPVPGEPATGGAAVTVPAEPSAAVPVPEPSAPTPSATGGETATPVPTPAAPAPPAATGGPQAPVAQ